VNLGQRGLPGMPSSNSGGGPPATHVNLGSGSPGSQATSGYNGVRAVQGIPHGVPGGTGPNNATGREAGQVNLGQSVQPAAPHAPAPTAASAQSAPKVLYKPTPAYTAEATALHLSGSVAVRMRVSASGSVTVLGITSPLGHGLDQSAERAIQGTRFAPALDASGRPVDWEGVVRVNFQLAG
jgi:TonB family protein